MKKLQTEMTKLIYVGIIHKNTHQCTHSAAATFLWGILQAEYGVEILLLLCLFVVTLSNAVYRFLLFF